MTEYPTTKAQREAEKLDERAAIVAWLRAEAILCDCHAREADECACGAWHDSKMVDIAIIADRVERGEHITPESGE